MPQRKQQDVDSILEGFGASLRKAQTLPNIYRYEPMPEQLLFHQSQARNRLVMGGNRGGKTFGTTADDVLILLRKHPFRNHLYADEPRRIRFIGVDFERGIDQTAIPIFQQLIPPSFLIDGSWERSYRKSEHMLRLVDGSTASFMAYTQEPRQFQSVSLHHVHFDEEPPEPIYRESVLRVLDTGGSLTISETPVEQMEWIEDELVEPIKEGALPSWEMFRLDTRRNVHLGADALRELEEGLSEHEKIIRLQGQYDSAGTMVFPEFTRKYPNVVPRTAMPREIFMHPHEWRFYRSMDHGMANPTAWAWHAVHRNGSIITFELLYAAGVNVESWAKAVLEKDAEIAREFGLGADWHPEVCVGDPAIAQRNQATGAAATIQQAYAMAGVNIFTGGIVKTRTGNQNFGLDKYHQYLQPRPLRAGVSMLTGERGEPWWQITDNCAPLVDEMKKARKVKQTLKTAEQQNISEDIRDKDNHAIDAVKYFFMATHPLRPPEFVRDDDTAEFMQSMQDNFHPSAAAPTTHREVFDRRMARDRTRTTSGYDTFED
jgi:phage terminase large subunit-like protein